MTNENEIERLRAENAALREQLQEEQRRNQTQADSIMELEADVTSLREQMAKLQVRFDAACEHVKIIQKEYESRLAQVEKERNELQNKIDFEIGIDGYR